MRIILRAALLTGATFGALMLGASAASAHTADTYTVQAGDTLVKIAATHDVSVSELYALNGSTVVNPDVIFIGQSLRVEMAQATPVASEHPKGASVAPVTAQAAPASAVPQTATVRGDDNSDGTIQEDESGWNCMTMGNRVCGPNAAPTLATEDMTPREWNTQGLTAEQLAFVNRPDEYRFAHPELLKLTPEQKRTGRRIAEDYTIVRSTPRPGA